MELELGVRVRRDRYVLVANHGIDDIYGPRVSERIGRNERTIERSVIRIFKDV